MLGGVAMRGLASARSGVEETMVKKSSFLEKLFARRKADDQKDPQRKGDRGVDPRAGAGAQRTPRVVLPEQKGAASKRIAPDPRVANATNAANKGAPRTTSTPEKRRAEPEKIQSTPATEQKAAAAPEDKPVVIEPAPRPKDAATPAATSTSGGISRVLGGKSREDAAQALTDGFRDLGNLLQGIHERMDNQGQQSTQLNEKFVGLPDMAKAQVDFMSKVSQQLVDQKEKTGQLLEKLSGLPTLLDGIHKTLERQAAVEERTEKNLRDFRSTMDRIHSSVGELSQQSHAAVSKATETFERTNTRTTRVFEETQKQAYETFQKTQEQGLEQLTKIVEKSGKASRGVTVMLVLLFVAVVVLTVVLIQGV